MHGPDRGVSTLDKAMIITDVGYERSAKGARRLAACQEALLHANVFAVRIVGSTVIALAWLAAGRASGVYMGVAKRDCPKPWDWCAPMPRATHHVRHASPAASPARAAPFPGLKHSPHCVVAGVRRSRSGRHAASPTCGWARKRRSTSPRRPSLPRGAVCSPKLFSAPCAGLSLGCLDRPRVAVARCRWARMMSAGRPSRAPRVESSADTSTSLHVYNTSRV